ncbi:hypothetical protein [Chryseobacterium indologenes]|uniref:Uncharacterized protein n=1 Tax=Chryseobacterium indologenes TaxID=253 RepID=A0A0N0ZVN8_CHRID|nr:hypothetical protein [Chryseobacterium indologenes]KPE51007.1 hypothetical protein AOB46_12535 [Chryseobacterium indologenes]
MLIVKLSIGEIELTEADIKALKVQIDDYLSGTDETKYNQLKCLTAVEFSEELSKMSDDELVNFTRMHERLLGPPHLTIKFRTEIFRRNGVGYKNVTRYLSGKQRNLLNKLGLKNR